MTQQFEPINDSYKDGKKFLGGWFNARGRMVHALCWWTPAFTLEANHDADEDDGIWDVAEDGELYAQEGFYAQNYNDEEYLYRCFPTHAAPIPQSPEKVPIEEWTALTAEQFVLQAKLDHSTAKEFAKTLVETFYEEGDSPYHAVSEELSNWTD